MLETKIAFKRNSGRLSENEHFGTERFNLKSIFQFGWILNWCVILMPFYRLLSLLISAFFLMFFQMKLQAQSQVPSKFSYQSIVRNANAQLLVNQAIGMKIIILQGSENGAAVYSETHSASTNGNGMVSIEIGGGTVQSGNFSAINWGNGPFFIRTETDPAGGSNYSISGTSPLNSVPFALYAETIKDGNTPGELLFWNGTKWTGLQPGSSGQQLYYCDGIPTWGGCPPVITTQPVTGITATTAESGGEVSYTGSSPVISRGVCWSTQPNPDINSSKTVNGAGLGYFSSSVTGLLPGTTYYLRAYASNNNGTGYGNQISFTTAPIGMATVVTSYPSNVTQTSAQAGGSILSDGGSPVTQRGVCWALNPDPTTANFTTQNGSGTGSFSSFLGNLTPNSTYYLRAYAVNAMGTSYGESYSFTTGTPLVPSLSTYEIINVTNTSASTGGAIINEGGSILAKGVCWASSPNPTIAGSKTVDGSGPGNFNSVMNGLSAGQTYYVRAYATNASGTGYGDQKVFSTATQSVSLATVVTVSVTNIGTTHATINSNVSNQGGSAVTERGVIFSCGNANPTFNNLNANWNNCLDSVFYLGNGGGSFTFQKVGLSGGGNITYFVRAFAVNSQGISYGQVLSFTTISGLPTIWLQPVFGFSDFAVVTAKITDGGISWPQYQEPFITSRGIAWGTSPNPDINGTHLVSDSNGYIFQLELNNLQPLTTYYVRAYAVNSIGIAYSNQQLFTTSAPSPPISDVDGNQYRTVKIGSQTWMAENLRTSRFQNGSPVSYIIDNQAWQETLAPAWCWYNHQENPNFPMGKLYNWYAVADPKGLCPAGWHVPDSVDMSNLRNNIFIATGDTLNVGGKMKSTSLLAWYEYWVPTNNGATNQSGFSGLPGGMRRVYGFINSSNSSYDGGKFGIWWQKTGIPKYYVLSKESDQLKFYHSKFYSYDDIGSKMQGLSVRCLKD
jgi:uncharacterized protein (TIGR02145 family)